MPTHTLHTFLWPVRAPASSVGWAGIQMRFQGCVLSAGSQSPACVSSAQRQSQGPKTVTAGDLGSKSIVKPCTVFSASWQRDTFNHIRSNNDLSLAATYPHAPRSQQHGSGTPWVAKCPLWKLQRQSAHSLTTTALVL